MAKPKKPIKPILKKPAASTPEAVGSQKAYEHFLPAAQALDESALHPFRADASLAYHNIKVGCDAVAPLGDQIKAELPTVHLKTLLALPEIALAVLFAASQVDRSADGSTAVLLAKARASRELLISAADALATAGVLPARSVEKIHEGKGPIDLAQDCIDLAALFAKHAKAIKGKTAVSAAQVKEAAATGTELLTRLKPRGSKRTTSAGVADAVANRDRLWSLLVDRHRELRRVGMWIWGEEVDAHVPPLQSRVATQRKKKADSAAPAPGDAGQPASPGAGGAGG